MSDLPGYVVDQDGVAVRFMLGGDDTVDNVDGHIYPADGGRRYATLFIAKAIERLLHKGAVRGRLAM